MDIEGCVAVFLCQEHALIDITIRFRKAGYQAIDRICDFYYSLQERPVVPPVQPGYLLAQLPGM